MQIPEYQEEYPMLGVLSNSYFYIISILHPVLYLLLNPLVSEQRAYGLSQMHRSPLRLNNP